MQSIIFPVLRCVYISAYQPAGWGGVRLLRQGGGWQSGQIELPVRLTINHDLGFKNEELAKKGEWKYVSPLLEI